MQVHCTPVRTRACKWKWASNPGSAELPFTCLIFEFLLFACPVRVRVKVRVKVFHDVPDADIRNALDERTDAGSDSSQLAVRSPRLCLVSSPAAPRRATRKQHLPGGTREQPTRRVFLFCQLCYAPSWAAPPLGCLYKRRGCAPGSLGCLFLVLPLGCLFLVFS